MIKWIIVANCILVVLLSVLFFVNKRPTATIRNHTFFLKIATTDSQKKLGLSGYKSLPKNWGMYFPFDRPDYYSFWMKNMKFPIDIIFLRNKKIVAIFPSVPPPTNSQTYFPTYQSSEPADSVLEISAGLSKKYGFQTGDNVIISSQ